MEEKPRTPSMDEKHIPSPPGRTVEQYEADKAKGINSRPGMQRPLYGIKGGGLTE